MCVCVTERVKEKKISVQNGLKDSTIFDYLRPTLNSAPIQASKLNVWWVCDSAHKISQSH